MWPIEFQLVEEDILRAWGVEREIKFLKEFSDGKSGARVYLVDITAPSHKGNAILKLSLIEPWTSGKESESYRHSQAIKSSPEFAAHFPNLVLTFENKDVSASLYSVAGGTLNHLMPVSKMRLTLQKDILGAAASDILNSWNKDYVLSESTGSPRDALADWLGYRLYPDQNGKIPLFLSEHCNLMPMDYAFSYDGEWYPNPYAFALNKQLWRMKYEGLMFAKGIIHGDLHGYNILARITDNHYYLIDLALYRRNSFLFYDHAYLELSYLLQNYENASFARWVNLVQCMTTQDGFSVDMSNILPDDKGHLEIVGETRKQIGIWVETHEPNRKDHMEGQAILARVAVGLNFVNKTIDTKLRQFALLYAAKMLKHFLDIFNVEWQKSGPSLSFDQEIEAPITDNWRKVWTDCRQFDEGRSAYIAIFGPGMSEEAVKGLEVLGRIPWSLVFDFNHLTKHDGLYGLVKPTLQRYRAPREMVFDNVQDLNFKEATCWFMAGGMAEREDTIVRDYKKWRYMYVDAIRFLLNRLNTSVSPMPITVLIIPLGLDPRYLNSMWQEIDDVFRNRATGILVQNNDLAPGFDDNENIIVVNSDFQDIVFGFWQMYGSDPGSEKVQIPGRDSMVIINNEDYQYLNEDLEIVHKGLADYTNQDEHTGIDFWRGNQITWRELDMRVDVQRDVTEKLKDHIFDKLGTSRISRNLIVPLYHSPGVGGTTLARRVAWDIKEIYPTVLLKHYSEFTVDRIDKLFQMAKKPILVVAEATEISYSSLSNLEMALLGRNVRVVFLFVSRNINPSGKFSLQSPMNYREAVRFYEKFKEFVSDTRVAKLRELLDKDSFRPFRSPFFFGLIAFERDFVHVPEFVRAHLEGIMPMASEIIRYLALLTRYSQASITDDELKCLLNISSSEITRIEQIFGEGPSQLILHRYQQARITHPLIAEEILKQTLSPENPSNWKVNLVNLCCSFISVFTNMSNASSESLQDKLTQLFLFRDVAQDSQEKLQFSELILEIPSEAGQHEVLTKLTERCPNHAHFWNHLARHHVIVMHSDYKEAECCLQKAISLDPENDIHYHTLGMVYRSEIKGLLDALIQQRGKPEQGLDIVADLEEKATDCFRKARDLDRKVEHGFITNIQVVVEVIERLFRLSDCKNYNEFLSKDDKIAAWCREKLSLAEELLYQVKSFEMQQKFSLLTIKCDTSLQTIYGRKPEIMVNSLKDLLKTTPVTERQSIRRVMADVIYSSAKREWHNMHQHNVRRVFNLMNDNLNGGSMKIGDVLMWFQAYRRLPEFDILEAIDRLTSTAFREESLEIHYYLYILHFVRWHQGMSRDQQIVLEHIRKCREIALKLGVRRDYCYEWFTKGPIWFPVTNHRELGPWDDATRFYKENEPMNRVNGVIKRLVGPQAGTLTFGKFDVFFVPGDKFVPGKDENLSVNFLLGCGYDGLRGWEVQKQTGEKSGLVS